MKISLVDQFLFIKQLPIKLTTLNDDKLKYNALVNYWGNYRQSSDERTDLYDYCNLTTDKQIKWLYDYIHDVVHVELNLQILAPKYRCIVQERDEKINFHKHLDEYNLEDSPHFSAVYTPHDSDEPVDLVFKYSSGKKKEVHRHVPLLKNQVVFFNSELVHCYTRNKNKQPQVSICFTFKKQEPAPMNSV
jgi:hypothetical protein